ncbi:galactosylceramide sulfotransferase-like isoform X2 [Clavelina lepadiformis]|uniref:galactosylceramide sulfotransferase-like isoform X2 n=1 Tax=Clavelina lepadiformis TaxID=159417 RepID=UPI004041E1EE
MLTIKKLQDMHRPVCMFALFVLLCILCFHGQRVQFTIPTYPVEKMRYPNRKLDKDFEKIDGDKMKQAVPEKYLMFLKTHKTAGTSLMNMIERYTESHNLTIALPNGVNADQFDYPLKFSEKLVLPLLKPEQDYNVICHHMRFDSIEVEKIMPKHKAKYVTILREPGRLFESIFDYYYEQVPFFQKVPTTTRGDINEWLDMAPTLYAKRANKNKLWFIGKNMEFFDFGFNPLNETDEYIGAAIKKIESQFDLVLISDYFLESAVLFKDLMNWEWKDMRTLKLNSRIKVNDGPVPEQLRKKIRKWNKADAALFDHFNATFWRKIQDYNLEKMRVDTVALKRLNEEFEKECVTANATLDDDNLLYNPGQHLTLKGYSLNKDSKKHWECSRATMGTLQYSKKLRDEYNEKWRQIEDGNEFET